MGHCGKLLTTSFISDQSLWNGAMLRQKAESVSRCRMRVYRERRGVRNKWEGRKWDGDFHKHDYSGSYIYNRSLMLFSLKIMHNYSYMEHNSALMETV